MKCHSKTVTTSKQLREMVLDIERNRIVCFDLETDGLFFKDEIFCIALKTCENTYWLPFQSINDYRMEAPKKTKQSDLFTTTETVATVVSDFMTFDECFLDLQQIFENTKIKKIAHNMKFDAKFLIHRGIDFDGWYYDTMLAAWQIQEDMLSYSLKTLYSAMKDNKAADYKTTVGSKDFWDLSNQQILEYSVNDVEYCWCLYEQQKNKIFKNDASKLFFEEQMMEVSRALTCMEMSGVLIDVERVKEFGRKCEDQILNVKKSVQKKLTKIGSPVKNINSQKQLCELFYDKLGRKIIKKRSVDKRTLQRWANEGCELSKDLLTYRGVVSLNNFVSLDKKRSILSCLNLETNRVFPNYNQHRTKIHRLSSSDPNLQNIPRKNNTIRECFIAPENKNLFIVDYSQIELRCFAHYSQDPQFLSAYNGTNEKDIHEITRFSIFGNCKDEIKKKEQRTLAKNVNFGIWYGVTPAGLASLINVSVNQASLIMRKTFEAYNVNKNWCERVEAWVIKNKWVKNCYGGYRRFPRVDFNIIPRGSRNFILREAVHFVISSTASCVLKKKMNEIYTKIIRKNDDVKMMLQIHDELIFEIPEDYDTTEIIQIMESPDGIFSIPLITDYEIKKRWGK